MAIFEEAKIQDCFDLFNTPGHFIISIFPLVLFYCLHDITGILKCGNHFIIVINQRVGPILTQ